MQGLLVLVDVLHKGTDAALIVQHALHGLLAPLVAQRNLEPRVEKGLLAQARQQNVKAVDYLVKNLGVGLEGDGGTGLALVGLNFHGAVGHAPVKAHGVQLPVLAHLRNQPLGQLIDHRRTHPVEASRKGIALAAELSAGMQHREHHFQRGNAHFGVDAGGNAASVVGNLDDVARQNAHLNVRAVAGQRLVDGVVHNLIDQMMQPARRG